MASGFVLQTVQVSAGETKNQFGVCLVVVGLFSLLLFNWFGVQIHSPLPEMAPREEQNWANRAVGAVPGGVVGAGRGRRPLQPGSPVENKAARFG